MLKIPIWKIEFLRDSLFSSKIIFSWKNIHIFEIFNIYEINIISVKFAMVLIYENFIFLFFFLGLSQTPRSFLKTWHNPMIVLCLIWTSNDIKWSPCQKLGRLLIALY